MNGELALNLFEAFKVCRLAGDEMIASTNGRPTLFCPVPET